MEQGKLDDAAAALARAGSGESLPDERPPPLPPRQPRAPAHPARRPGRRRRGLLDAGRRFEAVGSRNPAFIAWRSPAALALLQLGEQDEARRLATEELELARAWGAPRALGAALRAAGLVEGGERGLALLEEAVEVLSCVAGASSSTQGAHRAGSGAPPGQPPHRGARAAPAGASSWRRSAAPRRSPRAPRPSSSPPARALAVSP